MYTTVQYKLRGLICFSPRPSRKGAKGELSETFPIHNAPPPLSMCFHLRLLCSFQTNPLQCIYPHSSLYVPFSRKCTEKRRMTHSLAGKPRRRGAPSIMGFWTPLRAKRKKSTALRVGGLPPPLFNNEMFLPNCVGCVDRMRFPYIIKKGSEPRASPLLFFHLLKSSNLQACRVS